jgi:hypothetical protein
MSGALKQLAARLGGRVAQPMPAEPAQQGNSMDKRFSVEIGGFRYGPEGGPMDRAEMPAYRLNGIDEAQLLAIEGLVLRHWGAMMQELYQLTAGAAAAKGKAKR